eukprot:2503575-Heterocapsa_arctica.AAC.1
MANRADRVMSSSSDLEEQASSSAITLEDAKRAMDKLVAERLGSSAGSNGAAGSDPFAALDSLYHMEAVKRKLQQLRN